MSDKIKFVPLACDEQASANKATNCEIANRAVYLGDYSSHIRNILPLYNAVLKMPNIELIIAGNTDLKLESNDHITIYPRVNQQKVKELEDSAAIVVSVGNLSGTQIPGKLYYSASSQKHILVTIDGDNKEELKNYIDSYDRFDVCLNTEDNIREALEKIINEGKVIFNIPDKLLPKNVALEIIG